MRMKNALKPFMVNEYVPNENDPKEGVVNKMTFMSSPAKTAIALAMPKLEAMTAIKKALLRHLPGFPFNIIEMTIPAIAMMIAPVKRIPLIMVQSANNFENCLSRISIFVKETSPVREMKMIECGIKNCLELTL